MILLKYSQVLALLYSKACNCFPTHCEWKSAITPTYWPSQHICNPSDHILALSSFIPTAAKLASDCFSFGGCALAAPSAWDILPPHIWAWLSPTPPLLNANFPCCSLLGSCIWKINSPPRPVPQPQHSASLFSTLIFSVCLLVPHTLYSVLFIVSILWAFPLEYKLHTGRDFYLFCLLLNPQNLNRV